MSLLQTLLETINQEWSSQSTDVFGEVDNVLSIAYIAPVLAKYIESEGDKVQRNLSLINLTLIKRVIITR